MRSALVLVTAGLLTLAACGDDDPAGPATPNLVGTHEGTWTTTVQGQGLETTTEICSGSVTVTEQSGGVFEGTFVQLAGGDCDAGDGFVTGAIALDGSVTVLLGASGGGGPSFEESTGCTIQSADGSYRGSYADGMLEFDTSLIARCPETGSVDVTWTFGFAGSRAAAGP